MCSKISPTPTPIPCHAWCNVWIRSSCLSFVHMFLYAMRVKTSVSNPKATLLYIPRNKTNSFLCTVEYRQMKTNIWCLHVQWEPTYKSSKTGLCNKLWSQVWSVELELFRTSVNLRVCFYMKFHVLDAPYLWPYVIGQCSLGRVIRMLTPRV